MEIHYLSWLGNRIGKAKEMIDLPDGVDTLNKMIEWLSAQNSPHKNLFSHRDVIKASVNGVLIYDWNNCEITNADTITFFSPMAGG